MNAGKWLVAGWVVASLGGCENFSFGDHGPIGPADPEPGDGFRETSREDEFRQRPERFPTNPIRATSAPPPISGGTLAVSPSGKYAVAADPDRDAIYVLRLEDSKLATIELAHGAEPGRVAIDKTDVAHVILRGSGEVLRLGLTKSTQFTTTAVCTLPRGIAYVATDDALAVACASGELVHLTAADHTEISRAFVDTDLRDVVAVGDGHTWVSRYRTAELLDVTKAGKVEKRARPAERSSVRFVTQPEAVVMQPALAWRSIGTGDGRVLMLHQLAQREAVQADGGGYGGFGDCSAISQPAVSIVGSTPNEPLREFALGGVGLVVDLAIAPNQKWLAVAVPSGFTRSNSTLSLFSAVASNQAMLPPSPGGNGDGAVTAEPTVCAMPASVALFDSQTIAVAFTPTGNLIVQSREPAELRIFDMSNMPLPTPENPWPELDEVMQISLSSVSVRDSGHDLFHGGTDGGITCASCHGEMGDDAHVWTFGGIGPRRTQTMRGGIRGTEPFHWDGDMVNFGHLVDEVLTGRMSGTVVTSPFAEAMMSWIDAQPALRLPSSDFVSEARGKSLFESSSLGCTTCHSGGAKTNNLTVDVGTGGAFQVPSLRGLGLRAPFMHDGCASNLSERFTNTACGGGDQHGKTSQLSAKQIGDLTRYLQTL